MCLSPANPLSTQKCFRNKPHKHTSVVFLSFLNAYIFMNTIQVLRPNETVLGLTCSWRAHKKWAAQSFDGHFSPWILTCLQMSYSPEMQGEDFTACFCNLTLPPLRKTHNLQSHYYFIYLYCKYVFTTTLLLPIHSATKQKYHFITPSRSSQRCIFCFHPSISIYKQHESLPPLLKLLKL